MSEGIKKFLLFIQVLALVFILLTGCSEKESTVKQFDTEADSKVVRINIRDRGSIVFRLYPSEEKKAVERFIELCRSGYFNGRSFFYVVDDYLMMAGDNSDSMDNLLRTGDKGSLYPFKGALCVSYKSDDIVDMSDFYIVSLGTERLKDIEVLIENRGYTLSDYVKFGYKTELTPDELDLFRTYGGAPWLTGHCAVIGQAYMGLDVLDACVAAYSEDPETPIIIESIETE